MTDAQVVKKMNHLADLCNELHTEAQNRYGSTGNLFFESGGFFYLMSGDSDESAGERQERFVKLTSTRYAHLGAGAW